MPSKAEWKISLDLEKEFWLRYKVRICSEWWLGIEKARTDFLKKWLSHWMDLNGKTKILQIGPGAEGQINFLDVGQRFAIDPLADFFKTEFNQIIDPNVTFTNGIGEELPYEDEMFDLVIIYNSLDHAFAPQKVLSESHRVLRSGAILHVAVHAYPAIWLPVIKLFKLIQRSKDHPWKYTVASIKSDLSANFFKTIDTKYGGQDEASIPNWLLLTPQLKIARFIGMSAPMFNILSKKVGKNLQYIR